jgi:CheY-like chemotaxis protein
MGIFRERAPAGGQARWALLLRLRRLFWTPAPSGIGLPTVGIPVAADALRPDLCVLVVDDNPVNLMVASEMLANFGTRSLLAADGAEAVAMAARTRFDLILMDLQMPVLDGLGATRQIRRSEQEQDRVRVPVVAYTSFSGNRLQWSHHGIDDILEKPCELRAMRDCLQRWCPPQRRIAERAAVSALLGH